MRCSFHLIPSQLNFGVSQRNKTDMLPGAGATPMSFFEFDHLTPLHEGYAASVGRALAVCQHIESCGHHIMVIVAVTDEIRDGRDDQEHLRKTATSSRVGFGVETLLERIGEFHTRLKALCEADRLLSVASYEICEKKPGSAGSHRYAARLEKWAFTPILEAIRRVVATSEDEDVAFS